MVAQKNYLLAFLACEFLLLNVVGNIFEINDSIKQDPDYIDLTMAGKAQRNNFQFEEHVVVSADNVYKIPVQRIPGRIGASTSNVPVYLVPGLLCDSTNFLFEVGETSIGFALAAHGFDVWIGNYRGTTLGKTLVNGSTLKKRDKVLWEHTVYEYATLDIKAQIDYVLNITGQSRIFVGAHSQGNPTLFTLLHVYPEYNDKIIAYAAMAPFRTLKHLSNIGAKAILKLMNPVLAEPLSFFYTEELFGRLPVWNGIGTACDIITNGFKKNDQGWILDALATVVDIALPDELCRLLFSALFGFKYVNATRIPIFLQHYPAGQSRSNFEYLNQLLSSTQDNVSAYKYLLRNDQTHILKKHYNSTEAPILTLNVTTNVRMYYSKGDTLVPPAEVKEVAALLNTTATVSMYYIDDSDFTHFQFLICDDPIINTISDDIAQYFKSFLP